MPELRVFDTDPAASAKFADNLIGQSMDVRICRSTAEAVRGADIVTTVTADETNATILAAEMIESGMHINAVDGDCPGKTELQGAVLELAAVFVEYEPQSRTEGEIQQMPADFSVTELWDFAALAFMGDTAAELGWGRLSSWCHRPRIPRTCLAFCDRRRTGSLTTARP